MGVEFSYTEARDHLASLMDRAITNHEVLTIRRRVTGGAIQEVALIDADDLNSLLETLHLLSSPKNAKRLFSAIESANSNTVTPSTIEDLEHRYSLDGLNVAGTSAETVTETSGENVISVKSVSATDGRAAHSRDEA